MIVNFVSGSGNYSDPQNIDVTPTTHDLPIKEPVVEPVISRAIKKFPHDSWLLLSLLVSLNALELSTRVPCFFRRYCALNSPL